MSPVSLSILSQYDHLKRNRKVLSENVESEIILHLNSRLPLLRKIENEGIELREALKELKTMGDEKDILTTKLRHAKHQCQVEMEKRQESDKERELLESQIIMIRELLNDKNNTTMFNDRDKEKLAFLSSSEQRSMASGAPYMTPLSSGSPRGRPAMKSIRERSTSMSDDMSMYDKTGDDFISRDSIYFNDDDDDGENININAGRRSGRKSYPRTSGHSFKRSVSHDHDDNEEDVDEVFVKSHAKKHRKSRGRKSTEEKRSKGHRRSKSANLVTTTTLLVDNNLNIKTKNPLKSSLKDTTSSTSVSEKPGRRSLRKSYSTTHAIDLAADSPTSETNEDSDFQTPPTNGSCNLKHYTSAGKSLNRLHTFVQKTSLKPDSCVPCGKRIKFGKIFTKCRDCRTSCHSDCRDLVPLPCCPIHSTPGNGKHCPGKLEDYTSTMSPMIPALIIHCIVEIEQRGLREIGIYRVNGSDKQIQDLKEKFLSGKGTPLLRNIDDTHTLCGCVKDFLRNLKEPIVTFELWHSFAESANNVYDCQNELKKIVCLLPTANRDTLAYVILHLQRVACTPSTQMNEENLARVFGPTLVGYSTVDPEPIQMLDETPKQVMIVDKLLCIAGEFWEQFVVFVEQGSDCYSATEQPRITTRSRKNTFDKRSIMGTPSFGKAFKMPKKMLSSPIFR